MIERRHRSVYEDRELGWRDRLRRLFGREDERQEPLLDEWGDPTLVVVKGQPVGIRDTKGGVIEFPSDSQWLPSMWEDVGEDGWFRPRRRDWWR